MNEAGTIPPADNQAKPFVLLPRWWWVVVLAGIVICLLVSRVERAAGQLILNGTVFLAILLPLIHYFRRLSSVIALCHLDTCNQHIRRFEMSM